jgi:hypothetical protein
MANPTYLGAYEDELEKWERAMADRLGLRLAFKTYGAAVQYRGRLHQCRQLLREETLVYESGDPRRGKCEYDKLKVTLREAEDGEWFVYIERHGVTVEAVESLSELEP